MSWNKIPGWTCPQLLRLYDETAEHYCGYPRATFVEVGVAYGRSLAYMSVMASADVRLIGIDTWQELVGGDNLPPAVFRRLQECGSPYEACMRCLANHAPPVSRYQLYMCTSVVGASLFEDESCDFVFLDDRHEYEFLRDGILAWLPKIKAGGILAGHDINDHFPGVQRAVRELLPNAEIRLNEDGWGGVWIERVKAVYT
jgi:hypothetical protein